MMKDPVLLDIKQICAGYGGANIINDITLDVKSGETYGLIGLNGAGKTTLLKIILGLKSPLLGDVQIGNHLSGSSGAQRQIAYLPERFDPPWFLNAYEFINFTMSLYNMWVSKPDIDAMAIELGLNVAFLNKRAQTYSKGMRQKLGLMATFLTKCPLLILDEPMSGLDPLARAQVKGLIHKAKLNGQTIFMSSHILSDMEELCDRTAVLDKGRVRFIGTPTDLMKAADSNNLERAFLTIIS